MSLVRPTTTDDDGTLTTGTIFNAAFWTTLFDAIDAVLPGAKRCVAYHSTTQSLTTATITALSLNSEDIDVGTMHDTVTNNSRITIPSGGDGFYLISGFTEVQYNISALRRLSIRKNGTTNLVQVEVPFSANGSLANQGISTPLIGAALVAGDYVELTGYQNTGSGLTFGSATRANATTLTVVKS